MALSKANKALKALKERIETVELNGDMIQKAIGEETYKETIKCKDEIKTLVEAYEIQVENNKRLNKKVKAQRGQLKVLNREKKVQQ